MRVVVATPTGSTAYSFSAGGSILDPRLRNMIITPVASYLSPLHSVVAGEDHVVQLTLREAADPAIVSIDGQWDIELGAGRQGRGAGAAGAAPPAGAGRLHAVLRPAAHQGQPAAVLMGLRELTVENLAVVESVRLTLGDGFTVLTGETGAGKSLVVDAVALVLGARAATDQVRSGTDAARVEAIFDAPELSAGRRRCARWWTRARAASSCAARSVPTAARWRASTTGR